MRLYLIPLASILFVGGAARADLIDVDVLVASNLAGNQIVTGWYNDQSDSYAMGQRVFGAGLMTSNFPIANSHAGDEPGFRGVIAPPSGALTLPANKDVNFNLLPMTIGATTSNLFYWDGTGGVNFTNVPNGYSLIVNGAGGPATADGTANAIPGTTLAMTGSGGFLHKHPDYILDNGGAGFPAGGVYLISMELTMPTTGLAASDPIYFVFGTPGTSDATLETAAQWANDNLASSSSVPEPSSTILAALSVGGLLTGARRRSRSR